MQGIAQVRIPFVHRCFCPDTRANPATSGERRPHSWSAKGSKRYTKRSAPRRRLSTASHNTVCNNESRQILAWRIPWERATVTYDQHCTRNLHIQKLMVSIEL